MTYIGLDLGTSSLKAILIDGDQTVLAEHAVSLTVARPHSGWSEQDPQQWFDATKAAITALGTQTDLSGGTTHALPLRPQQWTPIRSFAH